MMNIINAKISLLNNPVLFSEKILDNRIKLELTAPVLSQAEINTNGVDVMLVLDTSGSMEYGKNPPINALKYAATNLIKTLRNGIDRVGIVFFNSTIEYASTKLQIKTADMEKANSTFMHTINNVKPAGLTFLHLALEEAYKQLSAAKMGKKIIIVMTDGEVNEQEAAPFYTKIGVTADRNRYDIVKSIFTVYTSNARGLVAIHDTLQNERDAYYKKLTKKINDAGITMRCVPLFRDDSVKPDYFFIKDILDNEQMPIQIDSGVGLEEKFKSAFEQIFHYGTEFVISDLVLKISPSGFTQGFSVTNAESVFGASQKMLVEFKDNEIFVGDMKSGETKTIYIDIKFQPRADANPGDGDKEKVLAFIENTYTVTNGAKSNMFNMLETNEPTEKIVLRIKYTGNEMKEIKQNDKLYGASQMSTNATQLMASANKAMLNKLSNNQPLTDVDIKAYSKAIEDYLKIISKNTYIDSAKKAAAERKLNHALMSVASLKERDLRMIDAMITELIK